MAECFDRFRPHLSKPQVPDDFVRLIFDSGKKAAVDGDWYTDLVTHHGGDAVLAGMSVLGIVWAARDAAGRGGADPRAIVASVAGFLAALPKLQIIPLAAGFMRAISAEQPIELRAAQETLR